MAGTDTLGDAVQVADVIWQGWQGEHQRSMFALQEQEQEQDALDWERQWYCDISFNMLACMTILSSPGVV